MLSEIFQKKGIRGYEDMNAEERKTFEKWQSVLNRPDVTIEDLKKILPTELERIDADLSDYANSKEKDLYLKAYRNVLRFLTKTITGPEKEREALKAELKQRFNL